MNRLQTKFKEAKDLIEGGWIQGKKTDNQGSFCLLGAIDRVSGADYGWMQEIAAFNIRLMDSLWANMTLNRTFGTCFDNIITSWNDDKSRTKEEVLRVLDIAIIDQSNIIRPK